MKDKEKNRIQLKKGLQQLPDHRPPDALWDKIAQGMDQEEKDEVLQAALAKLPTLTAPDHIWDNIEADLGKTKVIAMKQKRWTNWLSAASIALLIGLGGWWLLSENNFSEETKVNITYASVENWPVQRGDDKAGEMIDAVIAEVKQVPHAWEAPKTVALRESLEKIKSSIELFKVSSEKYGMNQNMHKQLTDMYNKRNKIVRALASMI